MLEQNEKLQSKLQDLFHHCEKAFPVRLVHLPPSQQDKAKGLYGKLVLTTKGSDMEQEKHVLLLHKPNWKALDQEIDQGDYYDLLDITLPLSVLKIRLNFLLKHLLKSVELGVVEQQRNLHYAMLNHELRSPLQSIESGLYLLGQNLSPNVTKELLESLREKVAYKKHLMDSLMEFKIGMRESQETGGFLLSELLGTIVKRFSESIVRKELSINLLVEKDMTCYAAQESIELIFSNLLTNAIKFSHNKGEIRIDIAKIEDQIKISVTDYGLGMDAHTKSELFKNSFQNKQRNGTYGELGQGFGLFASNKFAKKIGAKLSAESQEGQGSCISLSLPVALFEQEETKEWIGEGV